MAAVYEHFVLTDTNVWFFFLDLCEHIVHIQGMNLKAFRDTSNLSPPDLAEMIGVTPRAIHQYESGHRIPRPAIMARIREVTGGAVTAADFYDSAPMAAVVADTTQEQARAGP